MDKAKAKEVLDRIDEILRWERRVDQQKDQKFADLLHSQMRNKQLRVWLATEDLKIGDRCSNRVPHVLSPNVNRSPLEKHARCQTEITKRIAQSV